MPTIQANDIEIAYETMGNPQHRPLVMIMGLVTQLVGWPDQFCRMLVDAGHYVLRFDNRDVGLSTKLDDRGVPDLEKLMTELSEGRSPDLPYTFADMAADTLGLMDALKLDKTNICGISMGGMIAQVLAIQAPRRITGLICMQTTTGERDLPSSTPEATAAMMSSPPTGREAYLDYIVGVYRAFSGGSDLHDADLQRRIAAVAYDRMWYPIGFMRQMAAIMAAPGRRKALQAISVPTLVIHGDSDTVIPVDHGRDLAAAIPHAKLLIQKGLGHGMAYPSLWQETVTAISRLTKEAMSG